ncbi:protein containing Imidazole glycerol-phosphate dehydratase domain protein [human gut metagenome]|uniref:Protein containing Imidazole glycerol-phosphate dehydratase domain protein n=1 Tax=human gut metagenome TaxID=408170 RepID=K1TT40_9ZZZZ
MLAAELSATDSFVPASAVVLSALLPHPVRVLKVLYGENDHHKLEAMYKAFAKALSAAARHDDRIVGVLSTKGSI